MEAPSTPLRITSAAVFRPLQDGGVVLNVESGAYYELNRTACFLWEQVEAKKNPDAMATALAEDYGLDVAVARADVDAFLDELRNRQLVEP